VGGVKASRVPDTTIRPLPTAVQRTSRDIADDVGNVVWRVTAAGH